MWAPSSALLLLVISTRQSFAFTTYASAATFTRTPTRSFAASQDTPETLPEFATAEEYLEYLEGVSALPKGFSAGSADGTFVSKEAPSMGNLKIRGTVIHLPEGPTDSWAACFTSNKVRIYNIYIANPSLSSVSYEFN
jgi:hypothetical protein